MQLTNKKKYIYIFSLMEYFYKHKDKVCLFVLERKNILGIGPRSFLKGRPRYGKVFFQKGIVSVGQCQGSVHSHAGSYVYQ